MFNRYGKDKVTALFNTNREIAAKGGRVSARVFCAVASKNLGHSGYGAWIGTGDSRYFQRLDDGSVKLLPKGYKLVGLQPPQDDVC